MVASPTFSNGKFNFNGSTQWINVSGVNVSAGAYTVLAGTAYTGTIRGRIISALNNNWLMGHWGGKVNMYYANGWVTSTDGPTDMVYHNWAATGTTNDYKLYDNGTLIGSGTAGTAGPNGLCVGAYSTQSGNIEASQSQCGYVMVYNRVLSVAEIQQNLAYLTQGITLSDGTVQGSSYDATTDTGKLLATQTFTATGTWTKPSGCSKVIVKVVGGGGGGSGHCESGGGGGYSEKVIDVTSVSTVAVTVGGGGAAAAYVGVTGGLASNGGTSSFGAYCSATGGYGSNRNANHTGGHGGVGSSGDINLLGGCGTGHSDNGTQNSAGKGGGSYFGGSSGQCHNNSNPSNIYYMAPGSGGTGANQGYGYRNGSAGLVVVYAYS